MRIEYLTEIEGDRKYAYVHGEPGSLVVRSDNGDTLLPSAPGRWTILEEAESYEDAVERARLWELWGSDQLQHTPEPWTAHPPGDLGPMQLEWQITGGVAPDPVTEARYLVIATVHRTRNPNPCWRQDEDDEANARLFQAAPGMLAALCQVRAIIEDHPEGGRTEDECAAYDAALTDICNVVDPLLARLGIRHPTGRP